MVVRRMFAGMAWLVFGVTVALILAVAMIAGIFFAGLVALFIYLALGVIGLGTHIFRKTRETRGNHVVIQLGWREEMYNHPCAYCTGGAQALIRGMWGPIPENMRIVRKGDKVFYPPLATTRTCTHCKGLGSTLLPYPPKGSKNAV